jgi:hypothetical protein
MKKLLIIAIIAFNAISTFAQTQKSAKPKAQSAKKLETKTDEIPLGWQKNDINKFGFLSITLPVLCGKAVETTEKSVTGNLEKTANTFTWTCMDAEKNTALFSLELNIDQWNANFSTVLGIKNFVVKPSDMILRDYTASEKELKNVQATVGDLEEVSYLFIDGKKGVYTKTHNKTSGFRGDVWQTHLNINSKAATISIVSLTKMKGIDFAAIFKSLQFTKRGK